MPLAGFPVRTDKLVTLRVAVSRDRPAIRAEEWPVWFVPPPRMEGQIEGVGQETLATSRAEARSYRALRLQSMGPPPERAA